MSVGRMEGAAHFFLAVDVADSELYARQALARSVFVVDVNSAIYRRTKGINIQNGFG